MTIDTFLSKIPNMTDGELKLHSSSFKKYVKTFTGDKQKDAKTILIALTTECIQRGI